MSTIDYLLASGFNIFYDHAWRDFGIVFTYIAFNVSLKLSLAFAATNSVKTGRSPLYCLLSLPVRTGSLFGNRTKKTKA
jgi:hypothetical protein